MNDVEAAWVAGLLEGEGCFTLGGVGKKARITVTCCMTDRDVIEKLSRVVGCGHIYDRKPRKLGWKPAWQWIVATRAEAIQLMTEIRPLMGERRGARIDEIIEYDRDHPASTRWNHGTVSMFKNGCRCDKCVTSKENYDAGRRVAFPKRPPPQCGTNSKYVDGCRCDACKDAHARYFRNYRLKKKNEALEKVAAEAA